MGFCPATDIKIIKADSELSFYWAIYHGPKNSSLVSGLCVIAVYLWRTSHLRKVGKHTDKILSSWAEEIKTG